MAEALRLLHGVRFSSPDDRIATAERITELALDESLLLNPQEIPTPESHKLYTTQEILDAEARLLDAGRRTGGPVVSRQIVAEQTPSENGRRLSLDQSLAVEKIVVSGRPLDVLVGPAGAGKSHTMAAVRTVWEAQHGPGSVIGLAPSAAAAEALADQIGITTENTAKWLSEWRRVPELTSRRHRLANTIAAQSAGGTAGVGRLAQQLADLDAQIDARRPQAGQLLIVDEASLAGTLALDELVSAANGAGAKVLLVGDPHQLSAVEAGGAFALLTTDRGDLAPHLQEVHRFTNDWEKTASLQLRAGDPKAIDAYENRDRIIAGDREWLIEEVYQAWRQDVDAGRTSLMLAADSATVADLNRRARADRIVAGQVAPDGVEAAGGQTVGVGDMVITRQNDRRLHDGRRWVKNGDRWSVTATHADGEITVRRGDGKGEIRIPAAYVDNHVELAYATTAHQAQGRTVDTAHALISPTATRELLYVSATRGRESNRLYVDTAFDPDPDTGHESSITNHDAGEVLTSVLARQGAELSAHEVQRRSDPDLNPDSRKAVIGSTAWPHRQESGPTGGLDTGSIQLS
jgi:ATP-dependent exoDNAse (exonuclease V) alpha subunit